MPSFPKSFHGRTPPLSSRRSALLISSLLIAISGFVFGITAFLRLIQGYKCLNSQPRSIRVTWERGGGGGDVAGGVSNGNGVPLSSRHKVMGFVGIQTGFGSAGRRQSLRKTWMPPDRQGLQRFGMFSNEDATIGAWLLAMNVNHENNKELCENNRTVRSMMSSWCSSFCLATKLSLLN